MQGEKMTKNGPKARKIIEQTMEQFKHSKLKSHRLDKKANSHDQSGDADNESDTDKNFKTTKL